MSDLNMFDLLGFVPEELAQFREVFAELKAQTADMDMGEVLRQFGHEMSSENRVDFALGVCYAPRIMLEVGRPDPMSMLIACVQEIKALFDEHPGAILSAEVEVIMRKHGVIGLLDDAEREQEV